MDKLTQFKEIIAQYCQVAVEDMKEDMRFREDLGFSSLDFMSFLGEIEDDFDVELDEEKLIDINTIGEAMNMINGLQGA
ncbi:MAG: acyl carrier protein [Lachnospiraceae bacterium]|nr:acyl carrier protein [Lachnospiraceae bacterium]